MRYRRIATLGTGGNASVVLAEDTVLGRQVALKRMHPLAADPRGLLRLRREALVGASMIAVLRIDADRVVIFRAAEEQPVEALTLPQARRRASSIVPASGPPL